MLFSGLYIYFLNLYSLIYFHLVGSWWFRKQYHNNVFYAGQRGNYLCTQQCFLICQSIWQAAMSCYICMLPWYLILVPYNTIQVHEPQAETDSLKLFCFWPNVCSQYIDNIHNWKGFWTYRFSVFPCLNVSLHGHIR